METTQVHIENIKTAFEKMQSREDLLNLLNEAKPLVFGDNAVPFDIKQLTWYANPKLGGKRYTEFKIKKKSGSERSIHAPIKGLKAIQKTLGFVLQCVFVPHNAAMGFVKDKSIVDNAKVHVGSKYVYNIDLKDFFPSIDQARVWKCFQLKPFNLSKAFSVEQQYMKWDDFKKEYLKTDEPVIFYKGKGRMFTKTEYGTIYVANDFDNTKEKYILQGNSSLKTKDGKSLEGSLWLVNKISNSSRLDIANIIASLCCTEMQVERQVEGELVSVKRNVLPQGAPTSPIITNIICQRLDYLLTAVAKRFGLKYSRYADDITFSSMHNVYQTESDFIKELLRIITEQGFHIKQSKTRLQKEGFRKEVTGLLVNEQVNVQQRYIKQLRMWLYYWERYGYDSAYQYFLPQYMVEKGNIIKGKPNMENVISGKLDYLKMVKGGDNELYLKLKSRLDKLTNIKSIKDSEKKITNEIDTNQVSITLQVYLSTEIKGKLNHSISIPKDTPIPSTIIAPNSIEKNQEFQEDNKLFPHNPIYTISFLKKFKIGDGSGFKELVHDVILTDESIHEILKKVKSHPNFISHYKGEKIANLSFLNRSIVMSVRELINLFERDGLPYYHTSYKHPFNNDSTYTKHAKQFKKKYRYGSGSEYSKLQSNIVDIFKDQHVPSSLLSFIPDERKFNIRASFFTWQPSIYNGIRYIVQGIKDHSNINGIGNFKQNSKKILVEVERMNVETLSFVELRIIDCMSVSKIDSLTLLQFFKGSSPFKIDFRNLCDWIVECDFLDESPKRLNLLVAPEYSQSFQEIEELPNSISGFKHILRFYDVK